MHGEETVKSVFAFCAPKTLDERESERGGRDEWSDSGLSSRVNREFYPSTVMSVVNAFEVMQT